MLDAPLRIHIPKLLLWLACEANLIVTLIKNRHLAASVQFLPGIAALAPTASMRCSATSPYYNDSLSLHGTTLSCMTLHKAAALDTVTFAFLVQGLAMTASAAQTRVSDRHTARSALGSYLVALASGSSSSRTSCSRR